MHKKMIKIKKMKIYLQHNLDNNFISVEMKQLLV